MPRITSSPTRSPSGPQRVARDALLQRYVGEVLHHELGAARVARARRTRGRPGPAGSCRRRSRPRRSAAAPRPRPAGRASPAARPSRRRCRPPCMHPAQIVPVDPERPGAVVRSCCLGPGRLAGPGQAAGDGQRCHRTGILQLPFGPFVHAPDRGTQSAAGRRAATGSGR